MAVAEAQERIDSREFAEWLAYDRWIKPIGSGGMDDFMRLMGVRMDAPKRTKTPAEMEEELRIWGEIHNRAVIRRKERRAK